MEKDILLLKILRQQKDSLSLRDKESVTERLNLISKMLKNF